MIVFLRNRLVYATLILISLCAIISSCQAKDFSIFSKECKAPCWRYIEPGKTTEEETMDLLTGFADIEQDKTWRGGSNSTDKYIAFNLSNDVNVTIYPVDKIIALILFENSGGIASFGECVKEYGVPEYIVQSSVMGFGLPVGATSAKHTWVYALNPKNGVAYGYDTYSYFWKNTELTPNTKVTIIKFYDTNSYETLLAQGFLVNKEVSEEFSIENLYPWAGYGNVDELYSKK